MSGKWATTAGSERTDVRAPTDRDSAQLYPTERPHYPQLAREVQRAWGRVLVAFAELRADWLAPFRPRRKQFDTPAERAALDEAIEAFLREMAGRDRTAAGFTSRQSEDGLVQQANFLAHRVGVVRAVRLTDREQPASGPLTERVRERLAGEAFARLSEDGRLRFETRLEAIRDGMLEALARGDSPLVVSTRLGKTLDGYEQGRLRTIVRTEMAIASEAGIRDELAAQGVTFVTPLIDPNTDALCTSHLGQTYSVTDVDNLPPYHPNCFCSCVSVTV